MGVLRRRLGVQGGSGGPERDWGPMQILETSWGSFEKGHSLFVGGVSVSMAE